MENTSNKTFFNSVFTGTLTGLIIPCFTVYLFYCFTPTENSFSHFLLYAITMKIMTKLISICAIPNLIAFFLFMKFNKIFAARGIILATFLITFGVLIYKGFN